MNTFVRSLPLQAKLMMIGLIPFCFLVYLTYQVYIDKTEKLHLFKNYIVFLRESENINGLIDALQQERKYSFDYAITKKARRELLLQRPKTDSLLQKLLKSQDPALEGLTKFTKLGELQNVRDGVDKFTTPPASVMHFYSNTIFRLNTLNTIPPANTAYLGPVFKDLMAQKILSEMITYLGIIRSNIYNVLITKKYMVETLMGTMGTYDVYISYELELLEKASPQVLADYKAVRNNSALKPTADYINTLFKKFTSNDTFQAVDWWDVSDKGTDELRNLQSTIWKRLNNKINNLYDQEAAARQQTLILLILALVLVAAVLAYFIYIINRTLKELRTAAEKLAKGETGLNINVQSNDVIGRLAESIINIDKSNQEMANAAIAIGKGEFEVEVNARSKEDTLGNAIVHMKSELQQYSQKMEHLVGQRTEELARSNEDLQQFAHVASHDLKEPLRKISTFSNMLSIDQNEVLSEKGKIYLTKIESAARRMSSMIEGVLAYSTVSVNEPAFESVDLNLILEGVENDLELAILQKDAVIKYGLLPQLYGMPLLLQQLFYNLINNCLKFSKVDVPPFIEITSKLVNREILKPGTTDNTIASFHQITIKDNGIGFNPDHTERMFGVFFRLNSKDKYEGTGLGLALCRKIVHRHKGEIVAEGEDGVGATFHLFFPNRQV